MLVSARWNISAGRFYFLFRPRTLTLPFSGYTLIGWNSYRRGPVRTALSRNSWNKLILKLSKSCIASGGQRGPRAQALCEPLWKPHFFGLALVEHLKATERQQRGIILKLLAFLLFPALELYLLVKVGAMIGALNMVAWVFASALLGIWAVQTQGQSIMNRVNAEISQGRVPQEAMMNGLLLFIAGVLLILPGLITDAVGILLLIPFTRRLFMSSLGRYLANRAGQAGQGTGSARVFFYTSSTGFGAPEQASPPDAGPRQATVIDSTAVELGSSLRDTDPDARPGDNDGAGNGPAKR